MVPSAPLPPSLRAPRVARRSMGRPNAHPIGEFDADLMRLALGSPEVEAYVAELNALDEKLGETNLDSSAGDAIERIEREIASLRVRFVGGTATYR